MCDFHRDLGGAFVSFGFALALLTRATSKAAYFFGTIGSRAADVAYPVRRFNIANRPLDVFVPRFFGLALAEPPHGHAFASASIDRRRTISNSRSADSRG